jgi:hypothetical protein
MVRTATVSSVMHRTLITVEHRGLLFGQRAR